MGRTDGDRAMICRKRRTLDTNTPSWVNEPLELSFAALFVIVGAGLVLSSFELKLSEVQTLPPLLVGAWAVALLLGGPLMAAGIFWRGNGHLARAIERAGIYLAISAWSTYALTIAVVLHPLAIPVLQAVTISVGLLGRVVVLSRVDRTVARIEAIARLEDRS